ncbi:tRNA adenosine(34) deaminase TadA [Fodinibius sediminis]|uniref:tRNA-specific adenosine deaminase n=1 Tax=Fodinibius sediminis TaxID=1214077 RepID=A0A521F2I5_9BACT|nr:tRNA adenosine(34) deaminase TadA [Fodinibius sediminis]SMO90412.1 tRNA-adenosine deaminase [Fodinibius sediminis]
MSTDLSGAQKHLRFMQQAFLLAEQAYEEKEVPVGAIVVKDDDIIGKGYNQTERLGDPTAHAEMLAISAACATLGEKYLTDCTLYVTLEPCPMCAGALVWSKIGTIVMGALDAQAGSCGSVFNIAGSKKLNHQPTVLHGLMEQDCEWILKQFFQERRSKNNGAI